jgi:carbonic anhydrase
MVARHRRLVELNTIEQVVNVCRTTIVNDAWARSQPLTVHGLAYGVHDGRVRNLGMTISNADALEHTYQRCVAALSAEQAGTAQNDVVAADAASLADVEKVAEGVIKEIRHV